MTHFTSLRMAWAISAIAMAMTGCSGQTPAATPATAAAVGTTATAPVEIDVVKVTQQPLDVQLTIPGELRAYQSVDIHSRVNGFVKSIRVDRGSRVAAGDVITEVNGRTVRGSSDLRNRIGLMRVGSDVKITLLHEGGKKTVDVKIPVVVAN